VAICIRTQIHFLAGFFILRGTKLELKSAIDLFVAEFAAAEMYFASTALRSLSDDPAFVEHSEKMLEPAARFTLIKRMALVRNVDPGVIEQIETANVRAEKLREKRDAVARTMHVLESKLESEKDPRDRAGSNDARRVKSRTGRAQPIDVWVPTAAEIEQCLVGTATLRASLVSIADQVASARGTSHPA
jgi:hypothetical protein